MVVVLVNSIVFVVLVRRVAALLTWRGVGRGEGWERVFVQRV